MHNVSQLQAKLLSLITEIKTKHYSDLISNGILSLTFNVAELSQLSLPVGLTGYVYYANFESQRVLLGLRTVLRFTFSGQYRVEQIRTVYSDIQRRWIHFDSEDIKLKPQVFLTCAFDFDDCMAEAWMGMPNSFLDVPAVLLQQFNNTIGITFTCCLIAGQPDPMHLAIWYSVLATLAHCHWPHPLPTIFNANSLTIVALQPEERTWLNLAEQAKNAILARKFDKVVLARHIQLQGSHNFAPTLVTALLTQRYPNCIQLAVDTGNGTLVAASPERLVNVNAGKVVCEAVAGTAACVVPCVANLEENIRVNQELLTSIKGQHEHALVVNHVIDKLRQLCFNLQIPSTPEILSLRFVNHLRSRFTAQLIQYNDIFDLLKSLHPTPAVGGTPTEQALNWIKTHESFHRGWYTGVMGFIDPSGDGELALVLRCALLRGIQADLFAGAGIVADSDPIAELMETKIKFQTLLDVLQDV